jgi:hypothetical protein
LSALPDFDGIVLHPTRPRQDLLVLELVLADLATRVIKDHAASACRTLVDCSNEVGHGPTLLRIRLRRSPGSLCLMARSARCDVRPGAAVFVASDETLFWRVASVFDPFRRLLLQIGGANIAGADRALLPPTSSSRGDGKTVSPSSSSARRRAIRLWLLR